MEEPRKYVSDLLSRLGREIIKKKFWGNTRDTVHVIIKPDTSLSLSSPHMYLCLRTRAI